MSRLVLTLVKSSLSTTQETEIGDEPKADDEEGTDDVGHDNRDQKRQRMSLAAASVPRYVAVAHCECDICKRLVRGPCVSST